MTQDVSALTAFSPQAPILPGVYFWRIRSSNPGHPALVSSPLIFRVGARSGAAASFTTLISDLNGDAVGDVALCDPSTAHCQVMFGNRTRDAFRRTPIERSGASSGRPLLRMIGDFDADGFTDAVIGSPQTGRVDLLYGGATLQPTRVLAEESNVLNLLTLGDWDGDGHADVGVQTNRSVIILFGSGARDAAPARETITFNGGMVLQTLAGGDLDGDMLGDFVARTGSKETIAHFGHPRMTSSRTQTLSPFATLIGMQVRDFNGDGFSDLYLPSRPAVLLGGSALTQPPQTLDLSVINSALGDLNADGYPDLLNVTMSTPVRVTSWLNSGRLGDPLVPGPNLQVFSMPRLTASTGSDFTGDGFDDFVLFAPSVGCIPLEGGDRLIPLSPFETPDEPVLAP